MQGVKTPEGELPEGQEKLAWAMHVQSTCILNFFESLKYAQRGENTFSTRWVLRIAQHPLAFTQASSAGFVA